MLGLIKDNSGYIYYKTLSTVLRKHLMKCTSSIIPNSKLEVQFKISDVDSVKSNFYDEHLFVYILGYSTKMNYSMEIHLDLVVNICQNPETCKQVSNIMTLNPNNIIFSEVLYQFVTDASFRKEIQEECKKDLLKEHIHPKTIENQIVDGCNKMKNIITIFMAKSLILHLFTPFEKSRPKICELVCKLLNINWRLFDLYYNELEAGQEIESIRIPINIETKKAIEAVNKGLRPKDITIKYVGMQDLLEKFMDILWDEWKAENEGCIVDTDMFKEFASHINSKFDYNSYTIDFLTRDEAAKASIYPNEMTKNEVFTHDEIFNDLGSLIKGMDDMDIDIKKDPSDIEEEKDLFQ